MAKKNKLCFMDKNVIRKDSAEDIGEKCKKVIAVMKDELGGKITIKFIRLKGKTYRYLIKMRKQLTQNSVSKK